MLPKISVVTPSYNQGRFIERTIRSVLEQRISGLEYFVIDGGSTDETVGILKKYEHCLNWVSEKDGGQADAVNKGIRATRGEVVGWLNSDDIYYPGALRTVIQFFENHPEVDLIYGDADHIDLNDIIIEPYYTEDWNYDRLMEICFLCQPAVFFRRRLTEMMGLLDDQLQYCMDYEYWLRLGAIVPFVRIKKKLAGSRMYADNKTMRSRVAVHNEINHMMKKKFGKIPLKWIYAYAYVVTERKQYNRLDPLDNFRYMWTLIGIASLSLIHWKQGFSMDVLKVMAGWALGSLKGPLGQL